MHIRKGQLSILAVNLVALSVFAVLFFVRSNYEFVIYIGVIVFFLILIATTNYRVYYPNALLWALTAWAIMHMAGGAVYINKVRLYEIILIPLSQDIPVFRYDQLVHIVGFGTATVTMFYVLKPLLRADLERFAALSIIVVAAGLGIGALNEIVEFITGLIVPESGVGGYLNTSLDLAADLIGAVLAMGIIRISEREFFSKKAVANGKSGKD
jgi:putative membrane protein